jgi:hypothetical protein
MENDLQRKMTNNGSALQWMTTSCERRPPMEDGIPLKTPLNGRQPSMEDNLQWKIHPIEDDLQWKISSNRRPTPMEESLPWKTTFICMFYGKIVCLFVTTVEI